MGISGCECSRPGAGDQPLEASLSCLSRRRGLPNPLLLARVAVPASLPSSPIFSLWFTNTAAAGVSEHFIESGQCFPTLWEIN